MRHGEKMKRTGKIPICGIFDSELSPLGIKQSFNAGQKLLSEVKKHNISSISPSEIHIITSPYIRTLQTTAHFIRGIISQNFINNDNASDLYNISIEYGIRERLHKEKTEEKIPKNFLNFLNNPNYRDIDDELKKLKFHISKDSEFSSEKESKDECIERCKNFINEKLINFDNNNKYKVIVIISHAGPIKCTMKNLGYNINIDQKIPLCLQYLFDITEGIDKAKFIETIDCN
jgi:broad specificity phosphatase PhoE